MAGRRTVKKNLRKIHKKAGGKIKPTRLALKAQKSLIRNLF